MDDISSGWLPGNRMRYSVDMEQVRTRKIHHDIPLAAAWGAAIAATLLVFAAIVFVPISARGHYR